MSTPNFSQRLALALTFIAALFVIAGSHPSLAVATTTCGFQNGLGGFSAVNSPSECWRPYSDTSPFNREIPRGAPALSSSANFARTLANAKTSDLEVFGDEDRDGGIPVYWSQPSDPVYELRCVEPWGRCALEGLRINVPAAATPAGGPLEDSKVIDAHMTIVDQSSGWEYDLWSVRRKDANGGVIEFGWGGMTRIDGDGLGSDAIAARYGSMAGIIRAPELASGTINHALLVVVPCTETYVYPATKAGLTCTRAGLDPAAYPPMGARMQLDLTPAEIERLDLPRWKKGVVTALARYGAYVSDTSGESDQWGFEYESSASKTSFGLPDPWVQWARSLGVKPEDYNRNGQAEYWVDFYSDIPWNRMRFVSECAAQGDCPVGAAGSQTRASASATTIRYLAVRRATQVRMRKINNHLRQCRVKRIRIVRMAARAGGPRKLKLRTKAKRRASHCSRLRIRKQNHALVRHRKLARISSQI